jgi:hypothetical protein
LHSWSPPHAHSPAEQKKPLGQAWPQAPQLAGSACRLRQPAGDWQQVWPALHALPPLHEQTSVSGPTIFLHASPPWQSVPPHVHVLVRALQVPIEPITLQSLSDVQPH